ncbi:BamFG2: methyl-viologen-reducing hydrogenase domain modulated NADH-quinone oxidoreductase, subunit E [Desulfobacula toluolica Tol2]|uniref:BamFG2: methyl-viologen-reducing hydrogenase domain modulated NADH-quinone oxidoreductase, subunit E n=1 Tax=Desulfobacula toluolica (strain DSM 7467 / Tol2) TaxID=651182 RepID=K0NNQ3_DESTT|nr:BamFG2: methyl-viologen-reducing hydrogenase domain modulated NADH-quinone oxidoreductase, subunit E [Desulfobacula toluolica Tol2]
MCTGRVDLSFIFRAFSNGKDGVFIGGCWPGECHYITEGNFSALSTKHIAGKLLEMIGVNPERLRLEWISASEGSRYADVMNDFSRTVRASGPLGAGEGVDPEELKARLDAVQQLIPYIRLVERIRLRIPLKTVEEYDEFFTSPAFDKLFKETVVDKYEISRIMALLRKKACTPGEITKSLGINQSDVSRHLNLAARQGLCLFDENRNLFSATCDENGVSYKDEADVKVEASALDNGEVDQIIAEYQGRSEALIHVLMEVQSKNRWLSKEILDKISVKLEVPLSRVMQITTFYKTFSLAPKGRHEVHICTGTSCHIRGATQLMESVQEAMGIRAGETDSDSTFSLEHGNCLGCCSLGPEIIIDGKHHGRVTPDKAEQVLKNYA